MNISPISLFGTSGTQTGSGSGTSGSTNEEPNDQTSGSSSSTSEGSSSGTTQSTGGTETTSAQQSVQPSSSSNDAAAVVKRPSDQAETSNVVASLRFDASSVGLEAELSAARQSAMLAQERSAMESLLEAISTSSERARDVAGASAKEASEQYGNAVSQQAEPEEPGVIISA